LAEKKVDRVPAFSRLAQIKWLSEPYHRRFDACARLEIGVLQDVEQEICPPLCSTFRGKVMGQNGVQAKLCVKSGEFMVFPTLTLLLSIGFINVCTVKTKSS
jgi:hypothetical protein